MGTWILGFLNLGIFIFQLILNVTIGSKLLFIPNPTPYIRSFLFRSINSLPTKLNCCLSPPKPNPIYNSLLLTSRSVEIIVVGYTKL